MSASPSRLIRFGVFEVDPASGEIRKAGVRIKLQEKPFQLLLLLLRHPGEVVSREAVRQALWPADTFVDFDHSLGTALAKLRTVLGDSARNPRFIETLAGRGYRFIAPVNPPETLSPDSSPSLLQADRPAPLRWLVTTVAVGLALGALCLAWVLQTDIAGARGWLRRQSTPAVHSIAVLPLRDLSQDPSQEYFVDGMTEQLITALAETAGLQVISRTSAMQYKATPKTTTEIGRELHVDALVEGAVLRSGNRIRISAQLVDARTDQHLWAHSYERDLGDVLALQDEVARAITAEVRAQLLPQADLPLRHARTIPAAAQEAYLRGRYHLNKGDESELRKSIDDFNEAIANDPDDARSYAGLAEADIALADYYVRPSETMPRARAAAERAVKLDDGLSEAHATLGAVRFLYDWDWPGAEEELKRAIRLNDASADAHGWYGVYLAQMGRFQEASGEMLRAESLDPLSVAVHINAGWVLFLARQNDRAVAQWRKALDLEPNLGFMHTSIWMAYVEDHPPRTSSVPGDTPQADEPPLGLATLAGIYAKGGQSSKAIDVLDGLERLSARRYVCAYEIATAYATLGRRDAALKWLRRGYEDRSVCMPDIKTDPRLDPLRDDARFASLLRDVGFKR